MWNIFKTSKMSKKKEIENYLEKERINELSMDIKLKHIQEINEIKETGKMMRDKLQREATSQAMTSGSYISANQYYSSNFGSNKNNQPIRFAPTSTSNLRYEISYKDRDVLIKYISSLTSDIPNHIKFLLHIPVVQKEITTIKGSKKKLNI